MPNSFKFSTMRNFGSEQISFTTELFSEKSILSDEEIEAQVAQIDTLINRAFIACCEREFSEKEILANTADRRTESIKLLDKSLQEEIDAKKHAEATMRTAEYESNKSQKKNKQK